MGRGARGCAPARTGSQQKLSVFPRFLCGRDAKPLLQIWHCKQEVSLQVPILKLQEAFWAQGCYDLQSTRGWPGPTSANTRSSIFTLAQSISSLPQASGAASLSYFPLAQLPGPPQTTVTWTCPLLGMGQYYAPSQWHPQLPSCTAQALTAVGTEPRPHIKTIWPSVSVLGSFLQHLG